MRRSTGLVVSLALVAVPTPAADQPRPRPADRPAPLTEQARAEVRALLREAARTAKPAFPRAAMTAEQARHYADVSPKLTWECEFDGWFVFARPGFNGGPDRWSGVVFVQKGTNLVGYYWESW
jgi:hypothetical protein